MNQATAKRTTVVLGGTFSPVHHGHLALANAVLDKKLGDEVWLMPCLQNPLKENAPEFDTEARLELLTKAIAYNETLHPDKKGKVKVSTVEIDREEPSYTYDTLRRLSERYPDRRFRLLVGADNYRLFDRWYRHADLEKEYSPIVYPRPGYEIDGEREGWTVLTDVETADISSTEIREMIKEGKEIANIIPWWNGI